MFPHNSSRHFPEAANFAAFIGSSMNPTLCDPEIMEILPYDNRSVHVGDVVFFLPPETDQPVVHRIIRVTHAGIFTRGDNNAQEDILLLQSKDIKGQVVAAWRGQKRRTIAGGVQGHLISRWLYWRRILDPGLSQLLHPFYHALSHMQLIAWLLPAPFRPRVVVFHTRGQDQFQLLFKQHIIGRYDERRHQWQIQRPFRLFVDGKLLLTYPDKNLLNRQASRKQPKTLNPLLSKEVRYDLVLADGSHWQIIAGDKEAGSIVSQLGCAMQLRMSTDISKPSKRSNLFRLLVQVDRHTSAADFSVPLASENNGVVTCVLSPSRRWGSPYINLVKLSLILAREAQSLGGVLIHGALAERDGMGVILAAPGGTGKTTASNRIPSPWQSLCDDTTLVVKDPQGNYWAHPWPTWSRFLDGEPGGTWNVQNAVSVKGIFFLVQAVKDQVEHVGSGKAVCLLEESVGQVSTFTAPGAGKEELRALHLEQFNNLCALARIIPAHLLHITLTGPFWQEIEKAL